MSYLVFVGTKLQSGAQRSLGFSMGRCWSIKGRQGRECISSKSPRATDAAASGSLGEIYRANVLHWVGAEAGRQISEVAKVKQEAPQLSCLFSGRWPPGPHPDRHLPYLDFIPINPRITYW